MWEKACKAGLQAGRENFKPGLAILLLTVLLVTGYYYYPPITAALEVLRHWKELGGFGFAFIAGAFAGGVVSEVYLVLWQQRGHWLGKNTRSLLYKIFIFGLGAMVVDLFYRSQASAFGGETDGKTIFIKVLVDQFLFNPLWAAPFQAGLFYIKENGWNREMWSLRFYVESVLPVLISTWCLWIPVVACLYAMPTALQLPTNLIVTAFWALILTSLSARKIPINP
jgi:hypothetical protein